MSGEDRRIVRSKKALVNALVKHCEQNGITSLTVTNLVDSAGYSRKMFYDHYRNIKDFLEKVVDEEAAKFVQLGISPFAEARFSDDSDAIAKYVYEGSLKLFENIYSNRAFYSLLFSGALADRSENYFSDRVTESLGGHLDFRFDGSNIDPDIFLNMCTKCYVVLIRWWISDDFSHSPQYMAKQRMFYWPGFSDSLSFRYK